MKELSRCGGDVNEVTVMKTWWWRGRSVWTCEVTADGRREGQANVAMSQGLEEGRKGRRKGRRRE